MLASFDSLRVLIADDNAHMRSLLKSLLQALGVRELHESSDGGAAYAAMRDFKPDFVLSDLTMKPVDGIEFTRMVRRRQDSPNPTIPIIMVTGHTERTLVMGARDAGVTEFLAKPITPHNLISRITEIYDRPRPFVQCEAYVGPDRRRRKKEDYKGPWRRRDDPLRGTA
jgi:two-component system, chemotaxis family, chemotaxis protein CheY